MAEEAIVEVAQLLRRRNEIDERMAGLIGRPMTSGHLGEWIASRVFDIQLESLAVTAALDGRFRSGPLAGRSVNVKWYLKQEGLLDISTAAAVDYYLVLAGPRAPAASSRGSTRPWRIDSVFLFDVVRLLAELGRRGVRVGVATSVVRSQWDAAEVYPSPANQALQLSQRQVGLLSHFHG